MRGMSYHLARWFRQILAVSVFSGLATGAILSEGSTRSKQNHEREHADGGEGDGKNRTFVVKIALFRWSGKLQAQKRNLRPMGTLRIL